MALAAQALVRWRVAGTSIRGIAAGRRVRSAPMTQRRDTIDLAPPVEKAFLLAVDTGDDAGLDRRGLPHRARHPRDHGRRRRRRRRVAEPPPRRPQLVRRQGQGRGAAPGEERDRLRHPHRRRRAQPGPAEGAREPAQRQGHRPQPADPRHLRAARPDPRGPAPGGARAARVPAAAPDPPVDAPLAHPGRHRLARPRRDPARDGPPDHPRPDQEDEGAGRAASASSAQTAARGRDRRLYPTVAIVGYTNAGKSTLLNALVGSEVARAEDKLFATLDPTSRQVKLGDGQTAIVTDTVGFIHKLPHQLVDAFRATLEEVTRADVLLEVVDASDEHQAEHRGDGPDRPRRARRRRQAAAGRVQQGRPPVPEPDRRRCRRRR